MDENTKIEEADINVIKDVDKIDIQPMEFTEDVLKEVETIDSTHFRENFNKMYDVSDAIANKIIKEGRPLKDDSFVVREEFGEALAAGFRYLKTLTKVGKQTRSANHSEDTERDFEADMYKEIADVFMMSTTFCRHNSWTFDDKSFIIYRPINISIEEYLNKASEVLTRICYHYNGNRIEADYIYEFLEETYAILAQKDISILQDKIDKFYNKIKKVVE